MSYPMEEIPQDIATQSMPSPTAASGIGQAQVYRIKRNGARPLSFHGSELAMAMSFTPELPYWYEINLYRTQEAKFVLAIRLFHQSEDKIDTAEAWVFDNLEDAFFAIENYDAAQDVDASFPVEDETIGAAELTAFSLQLQARIAAARQHYRSLAGEILSELEAGQP